MGKKTYVKGKSVNDLLRLDIKDIDLLSESDLRQVVSRLADAGNKRIKRLDDAGIYSAPAERVKRSGKFSTKGLSKVELRNELKRVRAFLRTEMSTVKGYRKAEKEIFQRLQKGGVPVDRKSFSEFWKAFEMVRDTIPSAIINTIPPSEIFKMVAQAIFRNKDTSDAVKEVTKGLVDMYEQGQAERNNVSLSSFFETE